MQIREFEAPSLPNSSLKTSSMKASPKGKKLTDALAMRISGKAPIDEKSS